MVDTPIDLFKFRMLCYITIIVGFLLVSAVPIVYSLCFYTINFHFTSFGTLGGRYHQGIIFVLMAVVILLSFLPLPYAVDLFGENLFVKYSESLHAVEPAFTIPASVIFGKIVYGLIGLGMLLMSGIQKD